VLLADRGTAIKPDRWAKVEFVRGGAAVREWGEWRPLAFANFKPRCALSWRNRIASSAVMANRIACV
jgi:hypothetical protein